MDESKTTAYEPADAINDVLSLEERMLLAGAGGMYGHFLNYFRPKGLPRTVDDRDSVEGSIQELHDWFQSLERLKNRMLIALPPSVTIAELERHDAAIAASRQSEVGKPHIKCKCRSEVKKVWEDWKSTRLDSHDDRFAMIAIDNIFAKGLEAPKQTATEPVINYGPVFDFAEKNRVSYNELCAVVRSAVELVQADPKD